MRILFQVTATTMLRHFTDVVLTLAERGHDVRVAHSESPPDLPTPAALTGHSRISFLPAPAAREDGWAEAVGELRSLRDYLRYLSPPFAHAAKLRGRALRKAVKAVSGDAHRHFAVRCPHCDTEVADDELVAALLQPYAGAPAALARRLELIEATIPSDRGIDDFLRGERPDVVLVTPLIQIGSHQADYVKSARALGIPVAFPVFSWDNLSTKGLIHEQPDRLLVWNERQKREAIELHGVAPDRVTVTGAPRFDRFFGMTPATTREAFCEVNHLDPRQPIIVYLCSSKFVADAERDFVIRWIDEVRRHPALAPCNIVIRPHPREKAPWKKFDPGRPRVTVSLPRSISSEQLLFDTIHHSAAVVGLNTSAELEAGIVGRPVFTLLPPEFAGGQGDTLHFRYLLQEEGGFIRLAHDFDSHRPQLAAAIDGAYDAAASQSFIKAFLRPLGRGRAVSPIMADAVEDLARSGRRRGWWPAAAGRGLRRRSGSLTANRESAADGG